MSRLFTFGCSYTRYTWPTWANIIAYDRNLSLYNFGLEGLGNRGIAIRMFEADMKYKFKNDDIICILWSSWDREDRFRDNRIDPQGSVFSNDKVYGRKWIKKYYDDSNKIMKNIYDIYATNKIYKDQISWQASGFEYYKNDTFFENVTQEMSIYAKKIIDRYGSVLPKLYYWLDAETENSFEYLDDKHPDILKHLKLVEEQIYPTLGFKIDQNKKERLIEMHNLIKNHFKNKKKNSNKEQQIVKKIINDSFKDIAMYQELLVNEEIV